MPITFAVPPAGVAAALAETLPQLGRSAAIEMRAPAITEAAGRFALGDQLNVARNLEEVAASDAIATPVYVLGLDQLIAGNVAAGAKLALWAHIMPTNAGAVSAEVSAADTKFAQISNGIAIGRFRNAVTRMATEEAVEGGADGEVAQLRIPALQLTLLWLRKAGADSFEPLEVSSPALEVGRHYSEKELVAALHDEAQARAAGQGDG
ncbi:hypothetical protein [Sandarakinorhabdus sp. DWP1-3-1]|uniref:hypothetical protein n=1 Tax=Sandarakinorhabdus sp. DWP1-3-1 TaxID=2804627 RepID=UPI003CEA859C